MEFNSNGNLNYFTFSQLNAFDDIRHGVFSRNYGVSTGDYNSLNACLTVGDLNQSVETNRNMISRCMGSKQLVFTHQVHGTGIRILKQNDDFLSQSIDAGASADAMITDTPGIFLTIQLADCQGVLLYDPEKKVIANVHSGWRGSIKNILGACVASMQSEFDCRPETIYAGISPSLGPCCAEFINYRQEIPEPYRHYKDATDHFNFWEISRDQLRIAGLFPQHIEISNICTRCNSHLFYSFRKKKRTGRFVTVIGLK